MREGDNITALGATVTLAASGRAHNPALLVDNGENFLLIIHNGCKVSELFGNNGFYSLNNLKGLAIFDFFCIFVAQNVQ